MVAIVRDVIYAHLLRVSIYIYLYVYIYDKFKVKPTYFNKRERCFKRIYMYTHGATF